MFKKITSFLISFFIFYTPVLANAASTKEKWNNARNQEIRNTIGQNATYGNNSGRITVRNYDATKRMVEASLSRSATVNGSKASVEAAVKVPVNMGKVAATTAKRLARGGVAGMLGGAAVQLLLDGADWVMDPENNSIQKPDESNSEDKYQCIDNSTRTGVFGATATSACNAYYAKFVGSVFDSASVIYCVPQRTYRYQCRVQYKYKGSNSSTTSDAVYAEGGKNPDYDPTKPGTTPISQQDLENELQKQVDAGNPAAQQLIKDAYQAVDALGNATKDLGAAVDGLNDAVKDLTDAFDKIVKSDDPVATGNTDSVPTITTGGEASGDTDTQNKDKDGNDTGSSNSTSNFQLPAFCDWAADNCQWHQEDKKHQADQKTFWDKVTDWFYWTKDESDLPDRDDTDLNITTDFEEKTVTLNVSAQCPAPTYETVVLHGVTSQVKTSDYSFICSLDWLIKPFVIGFSMVTACFILLGFQRGGDD
ncbi:hypothetical protein EA748_17430 [Acinetobacter ursingii]|uniref:virulence factor TspB C-terminal domain-related protein n=1 Tax=Acinetobacter ursingii TaxID=108980 RepID=UPI000F76C90C|nr:virulence factor TspB C-terminal domain-related protein [Acinetobacter ursingii]RSO78754.1 hypothetical protein EA748_17430 [Acinetobacter ursingii]